MKKTASISILISLLALSFFFAGLVAASAQQPVPEEKKRAMHKLDPIDIFPQVQERGGRERGRDKRASFEPAEDSSKSANNNSRRNSRKRESSSETSATDLAGNAAPLPTPTIITDAATPAISAVTPEQPPSPATRPDSQVALGERSNSSVPSSQTMAAMNTSPMPTNDSSKNHLLPLPLILALLVLVLVMLILVFTKLIRYLRGPVS